MEMKLLGTRIKELRLKRSWSQEKLAEEAGLNPRTVQRAEAEGSASLRTRLQLAEALQVLPEELDAEPEVVDGIRQPRGEAMGPSIYYLAVLILVSVVYLAAQPAYFSKSVANFSWINYDFGRPWYEVGAWWFMTISLWALLSLPVLFYLNRKHRQLVLPYVAAFCIGLGFGVLKAWQPALVADLLTALVSLSGFALLVSLYTPHLSTRLLRHGVTMCLAAYLFLWLFQSLGYIGVQIYMSAVEFGREPPALPRLLEGLAIVTGNHVVRLLQLIPVALVFVLSLDRQHERKGSGFLSFGLWNKLVTPR